MGNKERSEISRSDNEIFNQKYKNQAKITPLNNISVITQRQDILTSNYEYYKTEILNEEAKISQNHEYLQFLTSHDVQSIGTVTVETIPPENLHFIKNQEYVTRHLNMERKNEIEYAMFLNHARYEEYMRNRFGTNDPIMYPLIYERHESQRYIVLGDDYETWSKCDVSNAC